MINSSKVSNPWVTHLDETKDSSIKLICIPYAGAGASAYRPWAKLLSPKISLSAIQLPGRQNRIADAPIDTISELIPALAEAIIDELSPPYALFGYSMGALVAFELAHYLIENYDSVATHLFVAACRPPHALSEQPNITHLDDRSLVDFVQRRYGSIPIELRESEDFLRTIVRPLRADLTLIENYQLERKARLPIPVTTFGGLDDALVAHHELEQWSRYTDNPFKLLILSGGHFFINERSELITRLISETLCAEGKLRDNSHE